MITSYIFIILRTTIEYWSRNWNNNVANEYVKIIPHSWKLYSSELHDESYFWKTISFFSQSLSTEGCTMWCSFHVSALTSAAWRLNIFLSKETSINIGKDFLFTFVPRLFISVFVLLAILYSISGWSGGQFSQDSTFLGFKLMP